MPLVKVTYGEEDFEVKADTIEELKKEMSKELSKGKKYPIKVEDDWRLFQFGFELLDAPDTKLEDLKVDDGEIQLNLVTPVEWGEPRGCFSQTKSKEIKNQTNITRFLVKSEQERMVELEPGKPLTVKLKGKFGIVTNEVTKDKAGNRKGQYEVFEAREKGTLVLEMLQDKLGVYLVPDGHGTEKVQLHSTDTKSFDEKDIITPLQRQQMHENNKSRIATGAAKTVVGGTIGAISAALCTIA